jgi:hypothetical protein
MNTRPNLVNFCLDATKMPYIKNTIDKKEHELAVVNLLLKHGYKQVHYFPTKDGKISKKNFNVALKNGQSILNENTFIHTPFGESSYPDILLDDDGLMIPIECKSSTSTKGGFGTHHYNNTLPEGHSLYILSYKNKGTLIAWGCHLMPPNDVETIKNIKNAIKSHIPKMNDYTLNFRLMVSHKKSNIIFDGIYRKLWLTEIIETYNGGKISSDRVHDAINHGVFGIEE